MTTVGTNPEGGVDSKEQLTEPKSPNQESNNKYATKKTVAQGLLDVGLLMANASQLKALIDAGSGHEYFWALIALLVLSILLQILTGIALLILGNKNIDNPKDRKFAQFMNNFSVALILLITVLNIFISAFGIKLSSD